MNKAFYENEYIVRTINRVPDSFGAVRKHCDNVHIIPMAFHFAAYNRIMHPRFIPSFV